MNRHADKQTNSYTAKTIRALTQHGKLTHRMKFQGLALSQLKSDMIMISRSFHIITHARKRAGNVISLVSIYIYTSKTKTY